MLSFLICLALLIGGAYLLYRGVITWRIPGTFIGTVAILTLLFVPVLYCVFAANGIRRQRRKHHKALENAKAK